MNKREISNTENARRPHGLFATPYACVSAWKCLHTIVNIFINEKFTK